MSSDVEQPEFLDNEMVLAALYESGFQDAVQPEAAYLLEHISYQHMLPYLRVAKQFGAGGAGMKRAHDLLTFDRLLRATTFRYLGIIEAQMRAQYASAMAERHGSLSIYDPSLFLRQERYQRSRESYDAEIEKKKSRNRRIREVSEENGGMVPIWYGVESMTMGTLFNLYSNTADNVVTSSVAESFGAKKDELANWSKTLTEVRNICAHFEPLYIRRQLPSVPRRIRGFDACPRRAPLYAAVLIAHLLRGSIDTYDSSLIYGDKFKEEMRALIAEFEDFVDGPVPIPGFPFNWKTILK